MKMEVGGRNKTCNDPGNCCRHTLVEAAKWDFEVRGKCWVLRSTQSANSFFKGFQDMYGGNHPNNVVSRIIYLFSFYFNRISHYLDYPVYKLFNLTRDHIILHPTK